MFWDFGSLHQKHRVGGTHSRVRRDGSDGWRSPVTRGDNTGSVLVYHVRQPSGVSPADWSSTFWCIFGGQGHHCSGTSVRSTRGDAASFLTRCRGSRILRPCRCGDFGFVSRHKPAEHRIPGVSATPDVEASSITSCCSRRVLLSERLCGVTVCLHSRRRQPVLHLSQVSSSGVTSDLRVTDGLSNASWLRSSDGDGSRSRDL